LCATAVALHAETAITGRVTNENNAPVVGARIVVSCPTGPVAEAVSDQAGLFSFRIADGDGEYRLSAERQGYFRLEKARIVPTDANGEIHVVLTPLREVYESVDVSASADALALENASQPRTVSGAEMLAIPFPASNSLKNALRIMPGVVQDAKAGIHVNGSAEEQALFTLDGFTLNDPLTGRLESRVGVESVQTLEMSDGRLPAEIGRGAAGAIAVTTTPGDDRVRTTATNFFPGIESSNGVFIGNWSPRFGVSGPIRRGRAWFSNTSSIQYTQEHVPGMPEGADRMSAWRFNDFLHTQVNLTPSQIVHASALYNGWWAPHTGLNPLMPMETTIDRQSRQWFFSVKDQAYLRGGALAEFGYAANRTYGRETPQGDGPLVVTPDGNWGNAVLHARRWGGRDQALASIVWPEFSAAGSHQIKAGVDVTRVSYEQHARRSGIEYFLRGKLASSVEFGGPSDLALSNLETSLYAQDAWRWRRTVLVETGVRLDRDELVGRWNVGPRVGVAWAPSGKRTAVRAGYGVVYEESNLRLFTRPLDQYALTTYYAPDGAVTRAGAAMIFQAPASGLSLPRAHNWSAGVQHTVRNLELQVRHIGRRSSRGFLFRNELAPGQGVPGFDAIYNLGNDRRDAYDSLEVAARQTLRGQYGWMASYTRSRAVSNAALDIEVADPVRILSTAGPMPWDSPHRFVGWAYLPLFRKGWAAAGMIEARSGFPYSVVNSGYTVAEANTRRFPFFFEWNQHIERRFVFRGHRWEFRAGLNNVTNHQNPNVVNANAESANFLRYYGGQRRVANFRIRWLGRAEHR
jgi:hypothetical protein